MINSDHHNGCLYSEHAAQDSESKNAEIKE